MLPPPFGKQAKKNPLYGKTHTNETKELMRSKKLGTFHSNSTKEKNGKR